MQRGTYISGISTCLLFPELIVSQQFRVCISFRLTEDVARIARIRHQTAKLFLGSLTDLTSYRNSADIDILIETIGITFCDTM